MTRALHVTGAWTKVIGYKRLIAEARSCLFDQSRPLSGAYVLELLSFRLFTWLKLPLSTTTMAADTLSELLIAQLLEEDMRFLESQREADELQLTQALADSAKGQGRIPKRAAREPTPDFEHAIRLMAEEARFSGDAAFAQSLQHSDDAEATANRQYAMKLAATEKKGMLDAEFARRLQEADDDVDLDDPNMKDAERLAHSVFH